MKNTVDILLAVYNGSQFLPEQLGSILKQSYSDTRLMIRDNCSTDHTVALIEEWQKKFPGKIHKEISKHNLGVIGNFTKLIELSTAPYIMFSDHDDVWLPNKVEDTLAMMHHLEAQYGSTTPLLVHSDLFVADRELNILSPSFWRYVHIFPQKKITLNHLLLQNVVTGCTMMANRALLNLAQPIPQEHILMHDWWLALVAAAFGHIGIVPHPLMVYRQHGKNTLGAKRFCLGQKIEQVFKDENRQAGKILQQARAFLDQYQSRLSSQQLSALKAFLKFDRFSFPQRAFSIFKYGLYKQGLLRNADLLLTGKF